MFNLPRFINESTLHFIECYQNQKHTIPTGHFSLLRLSNLGDARSVLYKLTQSKQRSNNTLCSLSFPYVYMFLANLESLAILLGNGNSQGEFPFPVVYRQSLLLVFCHHIICAIWDLRLICLGVESRVSVQNSQGMEW